MANLFESDSDTEELGFPNVLLPYLPISELASKQLKVGESASSSDVIEDAEAGWGVDILDDESWQCINCS